MAEVVLHIGTHKTGTTTIQNTFAANVRLLAKHGVHYPLIGQAKGHHGLVCDWARHLQEYRLPEGSRKAFLSLTSSYAEKEGTLFLSSEEFSRCGEGWVDLKEIHELLSGFKNIRVVCVLREQWQFLQSVYLELAKSGPPPPPPEILGTSIHKGMGGGISFDYNLLLDRLQEAFDPGQIILLDYLSACSSPGGILGCFLRILGSKLRTEDLISVHGGRSNVSPMPLASWAASTLARPKCAPPWLVNRCANVLKQSFGDGVSTCVFSRQELNMLREHFEPLNKRLSERRSEVQPDFRMSSTAPSDETKFRNDIDGVFWSKIAQSFVQEKMRRDAPEGRAG